MKNQFFLVLLIAAFQTSACAQSARQSFSKKDSIFGSNTPQRAWWDVQHYDITVTPDFASKTITGKSIITYKVLPGQRSDYLQIDLQKPLTIDSIYYDGNLYINYPGKPYYNEGDHWFIPLPRAAVGSVHTIGIVYHGKPKEAARPPWDGGWVWSKDKKGQPWMSVACEGIGSSVWYPCKDFWNDEPDNGARLTMNVAKNLVAVGNGRLINKQENQNSHSFTWQVTSPINTYNIIPYIGNYISWPDTLQGEKGKLDITYWVLEQDKDKAKKQFTQTKPTLRAFEHWFGPYPFYADGFQLVHAPYLGMEHQSAVAYGNGFENGYRGSDLSGTGWGLKWDYIIVHESGHEWFGNNITASDMADMWVHEGFTDYSETLFVEYYFGKKAASEYVRGLRENIQNDRPIIGRYNVRNEGSGDMYYKGANIIHTLRQLINDDEKFRNLLREMNETFFHKTVTSKQVENFWAQKTGLDLKKFFDQYLRTTKIPVLEIKKDGYRWTNVVPGFNMKLQLKDGSWIHPTDQWKKLPGGRNNKIVPGPDFYIEFKAPSA